MRSQLTGNPTTLLSEKFERCVLCRLQPIIVKALEWFIHPVICVSSVHVCVCVCVDWLKWRARTVHSSPTACRRMKACEYAATSTLRYYRRSRDIVCVSVFVHTHKCVRAHSSLWVKKEYVITRTAR